MEVSSLKYVYSVIRFVPDPAKGECVNVGVIAGNELTGEWQVRQVSNFGRCHRLAPDATIRPVMEFLDALTQQIEEAEDDGQTLSVSTEAWLNGLWQRQQNIVQLSRPAPIMADSVEQALDILFEEMVIDPAAQLTKCFKCGSDSVVSGAPRKLTENAARKPLP